MKGALPFTVRPNLDQYRKLAKNLVKACKSDDRDAIRAWAARWIGRLHATYRDAEIDRVDAYARAHLSKSGCALTRAQFVIARAHGFLSWPKFARLLRAHPSLVRARSTREHRATLLHYVSANGVEGYRQVSPKNAARIAKMLLDAGAEVDATTDVYEGKCTALGLVATSSPPFATGVQREVMEVLLEHGARMDLRGSVGRDDLLVLGCLANGQPQAAEYLAARGAPLDLRSAAGLGRLDAVKDLLPGASRAELVSAFSMACAYGRAAIIDALAPAAADVDVELKSHSQGHTGLHVAAFRGQLDAVKALLRHGARIDAIDKTWKTPPLVWALTGWQRSGHEGKYYDVVATLVAAGAAVTDDIVNWDKAQADTNMLAALNGSPS